MISHRQQTAHLVYGPIAAGKSTYARALAADRIGVRFAIDEWMHTLRAPDRPERLDMQLGLLRKADRDAADVPSHGGCVRRPTENELARSSITRSST